MTNDDHAGPLLKKGSDRVEYLLRLADVCWREYSERCAIEWKVNFALWAGLGAFGGFMFQLQTRPPVFIAVGVSVLLGLTLAIYVRFWKPEIQKRNTRDLNNANYYWTSADHELGTTPPEYRRALDAEAWRPTHLSQILITLLFVLLAILAAWAPR